MNINFRIEDVLDCCPVTSGIYEVYSQGITIAKIIEH